MFNENKWSKIEPELKVLPGGEKFCEFIRKKLPIGLWIGESLYERKGFPTENFYFLLYSGWMDIRWPLTFTAWYSISSRKSIDQECADFFSNCSLWEDVLNVLPEYSGVENLSSWVSKFLKHRRSFQSLHPVIEKRDIPTLDEIKYKMAKLGYKNRIVSIDNLISAENDLRVHLPEDYRLFMLEIGYGMGPYGGLDNPIKIINKMVCWRAEKEKGLIVPNPALPFPFNQEDAQECFHIMSEGRYAGCMANSPTNGCLPICEEGGGFNTYLVTAGEITGSLWSSGADISPSNRYWPDAWNLAPEPPGNRAINYENEPFWHPALSALPTFLEWFNTWLDRCLTEIGSMYRGKQRPAALTEHNLNKSLVGRFFERLSKKR